MELLLDGIPDLFNTLKCYLCGKYLSVGPVISISEEGQPYKCGRCKDIPSPRIIRNLCYEKVAAYLTFPCSYEDCQMKITWNNIEKHETFCQHRNIQCVNHGCDAIIKIEDFESHFKSHSSKRIFWENMSDFVIKKYGSTIFLLKNVLQQFLIVMRYYEEFLYVGVFSLVPLMQNTFFNLEINSHNLYSPAISYKGDVIEYDELSHCINCMRKKCRLLYHKYSINYKDSGLNIDTLPIKINFDALEKLLLMPAKLICSVHILDSHNLRTKLSKESEPDFEKAEIDLDSSSLQDSDEIERESV